MAEPGTVLIVGPVTWDVVDGRRRAGGTVSYAARTAAAMGVRAHVLTVADDGADLDALSGHEVHVVPAPHTLTLEHRFTGGHRRQRLLAHPGRMLTTRDLPPDWPPPRVLVLAPLIHGDLDPAGFATLPFEECSLTAQGLLRFCDESGAIQTANTPTSSLNSAVSRRISVFLSEEEVARWPAAALDDLAARARRVVITRGAFGAEILVGGERRSIPAVPARPVDATGAGDVFAAAFILAVGEGEAAASRLAAAFAAAAVEVRGAGPLPDRAAVEQRLETRLGGTPWPS